jgi:dolichyl-diphosphooligosaccharide--protein glycosyltransferase
MRFNIFLLLTIVIAAILRLQHLPRIFREDLILFNGFDSYYHLRLAEIIVKVGKRIGFDSYLNYPFGLKITWLPLYHWVISLPGIFFGFRATELFAAFLPVFLGLISIVVVYLIAKEVFKNEHVAVISAFFAALTPKLVSIHSAGSSDYHGWNLFLFLMAALFLLRGIGFKEIGKETHRNLLLSGFFLALLAASWLGASLYVLILTLISVLAIRDERIDFRGILLLLIPPLLASLFVSLSFESVYQPLHLSFPYLALLAFLLLTYFANNLALKRAKSVIELKAKSEGKRRKERRAEPEVDLTYKYKNRATLIVLIIAFFTLLVLYSLPIQTVRVGVNYILGISPYLPTIAEAKSLQLPVIIAETGMFTFLLSIPTSIYLLLKQRSSIYLFAWLSSAFILSMLQVRFDEVLSPLIAIYSSYAVCYILQASNIPVLHEAVRKKEKFRWGKTELVYSAFIVLFVSSSGMVFSLQSFDLGDEWLSALVELKETSPQTSGYLNPSVKPEYSVLSWWDYGNWILYVSKRPVVCNNFQAGAEDAAKFFTTDNESIAKEILRSRGVRYLITDDEMMLGNETFKGKFQGIMRIAGLDTSNPMFVLKTYKKSMFYRLHVENKVSWVKLLSEHGSVKVFEVKL